MENPELVDIWLDLIPSPYAKCPCGCGMAWRFAMKETIAGIRDHYELWERRQCTTKSQIGTHGEVEVG